MQSWICCGAGSAEGWQTRLSSWLQKPQDLSPRMEGDKGRSRRSRGTENRGVDDLWALAPARISSNDGSMSGRPQHSYYLWKRRKWPRCQRHRIADGITKSPREDIQNPRNMQSGILMLGEVISRASAFYHRVLPGASLQALQ